MNFPVGPFSHPCARRFHLAIFVIVLSGIALFQPRINAAAPAPNPSPDVLVLSNGDALHGKFVNVIAGKVTFHSDPLGDISLSWDKIKELRVSGKFGVLDSSVKPSGRKVPQRVPIGTVEVADKAVTVQPETATPPPPIPVANAQYILDEPTLNKEVYHRPSFFTGWNGPATAGATLVSATQNQYTFAGAVGLVRVVPTVNWLNRINRTLIDFSGSYGKITQPGYVVPASGATPATYVPAIVTKTAIYHADAERDEYFTPRFYVIAEAAFDHNFGQDLALQQIYGGGIGWTVFKTPKQALDLKATIQYEKQSFISGPPSTNSNLVGSTFSAAYVLRLKYFTYNQAVSFIPAYNDLSAYSANEVNTVALPAYKNFNFTFGTLDSYLNNPPVSLPPTKRNSFQFTMGLTYAIKSKY